MLFMMLLAYGCAKRHSRRSACWLRSKQNIPRRKRWRLRGVMIRWLRLPFASTGDHYGSKAKDRSGMRMIHREGRLRPKHNIYHGGTETRRRTRIFAADLRGSTQIGRED